MSATYSVPAMDDTNLFPDSLIDKSVQKNLKDSYKIRPLRRNDYHRGYIENLKALTWTGEPTVDQFLEHFDWLANQGAGSYYTVVIEYEGKIVGNGALIVERKFFWDMGKVGHVEDICISEDHQGQGLGKSIMQALDHIAIHIGCRKAILDCSLEKTEYYMKRGYKTAGIHMARDLEPSP